MDTGVFLHLALLPAEKNMCPVDNSDNKIIKNVTASFLKKIHSKGSKEVLFHITIMLRTVIFIK